MERVNRKILMPDASCPQVRQRVCLRQDEIKLKSYGNQETKGGRNHGSGDPTPDPGPVTGTGAADCTLPVNGRSNKA